jgi:hypothetical protein
MRYSSHMFAFNDMFSIYNKLPFTKSHKHLNRFSVYGKSYSHSHYINIDGKVYYISQYTMNK